MLMRYADDKFWVDIFKTKYGQWSVWNMSHCSRASWFYKSICKTTEIIKPNLLISTCNPNSLNLWDDPCLMDLPIRWKPTYINMDLNWDNITFDDFVYSDQLDYNALVHAFGNNLDWGWLHKFNVNASHNLWVWGTRSTKTTLASVVYDYLNACTTENWSCWHHIWRLRVIPRIKIFIWKLAHGKLPTGAYLYDLNIGPHSMSKFC